LLGFKQGTAKFGLRFFPFPLIRQPEGERGVGFGQESSSSTALRAASSDRSSACFDAMDVAGATFVGIGKAE